MGPSRVVPEEPVHHGAVECFEIVGEEMPMLCDERLRQSPVEAFDLGVHLRGTGIRMKVDDAFIGAIPLEVIRELISVVRLHVRQGYRRDLLEGPHEVSGMP